MLATIDKLKSGGNHIVQIEVTRICTLDCSNCTRLLAFRQDAKHMTLDCFREALRSLADFPGVIGIFGGNPPCHSRFAELMQILVEEIPDQRRRGLWANDLLKHGQLVRDVFYPHGYFNLNAHADESAAAEIDRWLPGKLIQKSRSTPAWHGAILMDRGDYGITEEQWVAARENCDINQHWSAIVMERQGRPYAYFCEVAGALDSVRGENNGILAEPGWWKWPMERFENQVRQCCDRGCGVPLRIKGHLDRDDTYDVSPSWAAQLGAPKHAAVQTHETLPADAAQRLTDYLRLHTRP